MIFSRSWNRGIFASFLSTKSEWPLPTHKQGLHAVRNVSPPRQHYRRFLRGAPQTDCLNIGKAGAVQPLIRFRVGLWSHLMLPLQPCSAGVSFSMFGAMDTWSCVCCLGFGGELSRLREMLWRMAFLVLYVRWRSG